MLFAIEPVAIIGICLILPVTVLAVSLARALYLERKAWRESVRKLKHDHATMAPWLLSRFADFDQDADGLLGPEDLRAAANLAEDGQKVWLELLADHLHELGRQNGFELRIAMVPAGRLVIPRKVIVPVFALHRDDIGAIKSKLDAIYPRIN